MDKADFEKTLSGFIETSPENYIAKEIAFRPELGSMRIFDEPLFGYASAADSYFAELKQPEIIGPHFMAPGEWLSGAETVISLFLPFTAQVREANRRDMTWPADEWLHARIEGQAFQGRVCRAAEHILTREGFAARAPMIDPRFSSASPFTNDKTQQAYYTSNWSERHTAYAAGLGTFGLSKGLITRKGVAGRFLSVITSAFFEPRARPYKGVYEYCANCGACVRNCPAGAISNSEGKRHPPCSAFLDTVKKKRPPYYGCGKCQVKVPCEDKAPYMAAPGMAAG